MKKLPGMTLVEVIAATAIVAVVSVAAYMAISAGSNVVVRSIDLKNAAVQAQQRLEVKLQSPTATYDNKEITVTVNGSEKKINVRRYSASDDDDRIILRYYKAE